MAESETFIDDLRWANTVYVRGGEMGPLYRHLAKSLRWWEEFAGKTLTGSSAGAMAIATYDYNLDTLQIGEGLGLLPIKVLVHYRSDYNSPNIDWDKAEAKLKAYKEDLPLLSLEEGDFKVFEQWLTNSQTKSQT